MSAIGEIRVLLSLDDTDFTFGLTRLASTIVWEPFYRSVVERLG